MAELSTITDYIVKKALDEVEKIKKNADEKYDALMKQAASDAQDEYNKIINDAQNEAAKIISMAQSKASQNEVQNILKLKIKLIDDIIENAKNKIYGMDDKAYSAYIVKMLEKYASDIDTDTKGIIVFNKKDKERVLLNDEILNKYNLSVSDECAEIDGGFIIKYGKVEENCSISAIFREKNEYLTDYISKKLFAK